MEGDFKAARVDLDSALGPGSRDAEAYTWRGELNRKTGRYREALEDLNRAVELARGTWAYANRALVHAALKNDFGLKKDYERIPGDVIRHARARLGLKSPTVWNKKQAVSLLETALRSALGVRRHETYLTPVWMQSSGSPGR